MTPAVVAFRLAMLSKGLSVETLAKIVALLQAVNDFSEDEQSQFDSFLHDFRKDK